METPNAFTLFPYPLELESLMIDIERWYTPSVTNEDILWLHAYVQGAVRPLTRLQQFRIW
jgi:hypothetical protein